jgi:hypothetical protein
MAKKLTNAQLRQQVANLNDALEIAMGASSETDNNFFTGGLSTAYTDRNEWDRRKVFEEALRAWRVNPLARRIIRLVRSFVLGKRVQIKADKPKTQKYLQDWWNHPLNNLNENVKRWLDETSRTGNLFLLCTVGQSSTLYVRAIPSELIDKIETMENDIEQETAYILNQNANLGEDSYPSYAHRGEANKFVLHFATNKPVGSSWGEADIAPMLPWIGRYASWLEDRVRLNRYRNAFMYIVQQSGANVTPESKKARQMELNANPPKPGSILVTDPTEQWGIMSPNLDAFDANTDGLAVKKMISAGQGFPLHFLAEPESATRTTAEAAGTPTFRTLEEQQEEYFSWLVTLAKIALETAGMKTNMDIWIHGPDITERDNASLALGFARSFPMFAEMLDREAIDDAEFLRLCYKMLAEVWEEEDTPKIKRKPLVEPKQNTTAQTEDPKTDPTDTPEDE